MSLVDEPFTVVRNEIPGIKFTGGYEGNVESPDSSETIHYHELGDNFDVDVQNWMTSPLNVRSTLVLLLRDAGNNLSTLSLSHNGDVTISGKRPYGCKLDLSSLPNPKITNGCELRSLKYTQLESETGSTINRGLTHVRNMLKRSQLIWGEERLFTVVRAAIAMDENVLVANESVGIKLRNQMNRQ